MTNESEGKKRYPLNGAEVERLWKKTGLPLRTLADEAGIAWKSLYNWKNGVTDPEYENIEKIAKALGVGTYRIIQGNPDNPVTLPDLIESAIQEEAASSKKKSRPERRLFGILGELLKNHRDTVAYYKDYIHLRLWPESGIVRTFPHEGKRKNFYAEVTLTPKVWPPQVLIPRDRFIFSFSLGPLLIDYGQLLISPEGDAAIYYFFAGNSTVEPYARAKAKAGGVVRVWNWFGVDPCKFTVRSRQTEFSLTLQDDDPGRDPTKDREAKKAAGEDDVVCFLRTPQQEAAMDG